MKRRIFLILTILCTVFNLREVQACGEITELNSSVGTVASLGGGRYLVTVPEGTKETILIGTSDSDWVSGYEPRNVPTDKGPMTLKVDGTTCGGSIYSYTVEFKILSNIIAEGEATTPNENTSKEESKDESDSPISEPNYGVLELTKLEIAGIEFTFDPKTHTYDLEFQEATNRLSIEAIASEKSATVNIGENAYDLKHGKNTITISLEDPYGNTGLYVLNIEKTAAKSPNNFLASLSVSNYQLNFDPSNTSYTLEIGKESSLDIKAVSESELAKVEILGNQNLSDGSSIIVRVTAENGTTKDYVISVKRAFNIMDYWIYIVIVLLLILLIIILLITKRKKSNKKKADGPEDIEVQATTAGIIQEVAPQNQNSASSVTTSTTDENGVQTLKQATTLHIIEPTNIDSAQEESDTTDSSTEIFQL